MNLDSSTAATPGEIPDQAQAPRRPWGTCALKWWLFYWVSLCAWVFLYFYRDSTLEQPGSDDMLGMVMISAMFGAAGSIIWFVLPIPLTSFLLRRWPRFRSALLAFVWLGLTTAGALFIARNTPEKRFEVITHMDWSLAPCVAGFHKNSAHLWVFQGTPEHLEKQLSALPWQKQESAEIWKNHDDIIYLRRTREVFKSEPWEPQEYYQFGNDRRDEVESTLPYATAHLLVDAQRKRWMIWWIQM